MTGQEISTTTRRLFPTAALSPTPNPEPRYRATGVAILDGGVGLVSFDYQTLNELGTCAYVNIVFSPLDGTQLSILHLLLRLSQFLDAKAISQLHLRLPERGAKQSMGVNSDHIVSAMHALVDVRVKDVFDLEVAEWVTRNRPSVLMPNIPQDDPFAVLALQAAAETALYSAYADLGGRDYGHA